MIEKDSKKVIIYEANQRNKLGIVESLIYIFSNLINSRELIWELFKRDFIGNYKQSLLGILWIFFSPLIGIISWVFMNYTGILNPGEVSVPYPVYVLLGSSIWGFFISMYNATANSISSSGQLIIQIKFPHEVLIAQQLTQTIANFVINLLLISIILFIFDITPSWKSIFFPLTLIPIFLIGTGIGLIGAVVSVVIHDFNKIVNAGLSLLMFLTPIIYTPKIQNEIIQKIIKWNPLSYLICGARDIVLSGEINNQYNYIYSFLFSILIFLISCRFFFLSEPKIIEKL